MSNAEEYCAPLRKNRQHKGRLEIYGKLLVSCKSPTIQINLLRKAGCHARDVVYIQDLVRKGCLERSRVGDGDWSRIRYALTDKGKVFEEHFEAVFELVNDQG